MSVEYCCLIAKKEKVIISESNYKDNPSYSKRILPTVPTMISGHMMDFIEIEMEKAISYFRTKRIVFVCVQSAKVGKEKPKRFLEQMVILINNEYGNINGMLDSIPKISKNCLQDRLEDKFNKLLDDFDTGLYNNRGSIATMNADISEMKLDLNNQIKIILDNNNNLNELLVVSQKIQTNAEDFKANAKVLEYETRCFKPWMVYTIIVLTVAFIVFIIFALVKCGNLSIACN
jgi:hypothetical protein